MVQRTEVSPEQIARRAHELFEQRGREHGKDVEDWVAAEKELSAEPAVALSTTVTSQRAASSGRKAS